MDSIRTPEELLEYMDSITYGFVDKDGNKNINDFSNWDNCVVQDGEEVLKSKVGTCWDQVELERLWFTINNYSFKTIFCWFECGRICNLPTHTFLIYENNGKYYWFEHAFEACKGIHEYDSLEDAINDVRDKQIEFVSHSEDYRPGDENTLVCYEYSEPDKNLSVQEYLDFVTNVKLIFKR